MRASFRVLLALAACCACVALVPAQADPNAMLDPNWVDPNLQTEGFSAALTAAGVAGNPLGLVPAVSQAEGMEAPNGGMTFSSQHNAEQSDDAENLWSWEFGGYNVETVGLTTVHNLKDPSWPVVITLFETVSSPDFYPIANGQITKQALAALAAALGYSDIFAATNASALGVVARMASDPTQAIFGILGQDTSETVLEGGVDMPINDDTFIPLTQEEIDALPDPADLKTPTDGEEVQPPSTVVDVIVPTGTVPATSAPSGSAAPQASPSPVLAPNADDDASTPSSAPAPKPSVAPAPAPAAPPPAPAPKSSAAAVRATSVVVASMLAGFVMLA